MEEEITLFPICAGSIGPIKMYESVAIKLEFLTSALQKFDEANETPNFTLTVRPGSPIVECPAISSA